MKVRDIQSVIEGWAPREIAWERDNVGLQVGDLAADVAGVLVALDVTERIIAETRQKKANLLISHHPLLFKPIRSVTPHSWTGKCILALVQGGINLYSAHTNLDFTRGGTSFALAQALDLHDVDFLYKSYQLQKKIVTFVPADHVQKVADAMADAGAGRIGNYDRCSFRTPGTGTFQGNAASSPTVGKRGKLESIEEVRLEMIATQWQLPSIVRAMKGAHPYEEVAYDVYAVENKSTDYGMGIIGELERPVKLKPFLSRVKRALGASGLRCTGDPDKRIRRVAACGGSGSDLTEEAIAQHADVFITADVKYHSFHDAGDRIALIDAGHYETEHPVIQSVVNKLKQDLQHAGEQIPVHAAQTSTNPVHYV
jgi:dinuclear metal center YbgI/SA1388 family protein